MKTLRYTLTFGFLLLLTSCKKDEEVTKRVRFTTTTYQSLSTHDSLGKPGNLLTRDMVSTELRTYIRTTLPERTDLRTTNPELLTTKAIADITITQSSEVFITFVSQGTSFSNVIAFYTYPSNNPPKTPKDIQTITYVFPNAGFRTPLVAGDKVRLGRFEVGTSIGFVLLQDGFNRTTANINNEVVHFCSNDALNPEVDPNLKKHAVLINYPAENKVLIGFEDLDRTKKDCDHDFNDVVIFATVKP